MTTRDADEELDTLATAFDRETDPLAQHAKTFSESGVDPFGLYTSKVIEPRGLTESTIDNYKRAFRHWSEYMDQEGRHPACPNEKHVKGFIEFELNRGLQPHTANKKIDKLNSAYQWWQDHHAFPHPQDYNPFSLARSEMRLSKPEQKDPPRIPVDKLREVLTTVTNVRERAVIVTQLKLGLRAGELCNIKLSDVSIRNSDLNDHYDRLGTHPRLEGRENAIYIPHDRSGNKSKRPRILPLDDELRRVLIEYLAVRPDIETPWLFLSTTHYAKIQDPDKITYVWKKHFQPEYEETERYRAVTSHFGRHRFSTYWKVEQDVNREMVQYMRGDKFATSATERDGIDHYLHTYFEDIEGLYRDNIFKLRV